MDAKVTWVQGMSFDAVADSGHVVRLSTSKANGGEGDGPSAMELVLMAVAGCTAYDVVSILKKKRQELDSLEVKVNASRVDTYPRVYEKIMVEYVVGGEGLDLKAVEQAVSLSVDKYCSVSAMLQGTVPIEHKITMI
jgi:putative redox protein